MIDEDSCGTLAVRSRCIRCGYALHGLKKRRCPECGYRFDPQNARTFIDPVRRRNLYARGVVVQLLPLVYSISSFWVDGNASVTDRLLASAFLIAGPMSWIGVAILHFSGSAVFSAAVLPVGFLMYLLWLRMVFRRPTLYDMPLWAHFAIGCAWWLSSCPPTGFVVNHYL